MYRGFLHLAAPLMPIQPLLLFQRGAASVALRSITSAQGVLQQLLDMGVVGGLPEDLQWTIRMLLPKPPSCAPAADNNPAAFLSDSSCPCISLHS